MEEWIIKLSTRSRYGTRLMLRLALNYGKGPVFLRDIAREEGVSEKYLSQLVIPLRSNSLIVSLRGSKGGYTLARSPRDITLGEVVEALEGGLELVDCVHNPSLCDRSKYCVTRDLWGELEESIRERLFSITLQDLVERHLRKKDAPTYSI